MKKSILFVDDEIRLLRALSLSFRKKGFIVELAATGAEARKKVKENDFDLVLLDLRLPDANGLDLLEEFVSLYPQKLFMIMTAYGDIESAVIAMKSGAIDYIVKPAKLDEIELAINKAFSWLEMKKENLYLKEQLKQVEPTKGLISISNEMKDIYTLVERVSSTDATVLIHGESGTGKSMIAKIIHQLSDRSEAPFIVVNCAAIPENLLESELFGYEKGAFTGATASRAGKFEAAHRGTIFLDEIGEISLQLQAKLLQAVQEKSFMRLGSNQLKQVDIRIISATNSNLKQMVKEGKFREDLFYRLNIVDMYIPPLRDRIDDIPLLIEEFLERHRQKTKINYKVSSHLLTILTNYDWPGNVRELQNAVERAVVLCDGENLSIRDFPREIQEYNNRQFRLESFSLNQGKTLPEQLEEIEKKFILTAVEEQHGQVAAAARKLGISRQLLSYKLNKYLNQ
ncbi:sigma-54 dependent transcriptional regulator [Siminovitchia fortis]|uniref:Sigma-54-dependent Fis family transcriptional regulator n=1 Tax=Siminovitchia fortis TaxID=254758 RepID=A0A443IZV0_9BACI|nr:sigma-54 dependent transcriptional regulator [Siminovitchia fortis]RWR13650.1 sigma-54-dependent Fis family transcriptional regulator [Siminovitchia fortis]WHY81886.1 sigma-54 dependent transcriptional regulator [Siminovitchia fortis]